MKNLSLLKVLMMALAIFVISSCGDDGDDPFVLGPDVSLSDDAGFVSLSADVAPGATFSVKVIATKGDSPLKSLTVAEDGATLDVSRMTITSIPTTNNPQLIIEDADKDAISWEITITAQSGESVNTYDFTVADDANETGFASVDINTVAQTVLDVTLGDGGTGCFTASANFDMPSNFCLSASATRGSAELSTVSVFENNDLVDVSRLDIASNPTTLDLDAVNGFSDWIVNIDSHSAGTSEYRIVVTDTDGNSVESGIFIGIGAAVSEITGALLNAGGPSGTGGLDLDTGIGTGSNDAAAEIKDEGIDAGPIDMNWIQKISPTNNAQLRDASAVSGDLTYDNITLSSQIEEAFNAGTPISVTAEKVVIGDEFVIERDGNYYYIQITNVVVTPADNEDKYEMSIKK